jgi:hypothetical protein
MIRTKSHSDFYPRGPNEAVGGVEVALMSVWPEGELVLFAKVFIVWSIVSGIDLYLLPLVFNYMLYALTSKTTHNTIDMPESARMHSRRRNTLHLHGQRHTHATFRYPQDSRSTSIQNTSLSNQCIGSVGGEERGFKTRGVGRRCFE